MEYFKLSVMIWYILLQRIISWMLILSNFKCSARRKKSTYEMAGSAYFSGLQLIKLVNHACCAALGLLTFLPLSCLAVTHQPVCHRCIPVPGKWIISSLALLCDPCATPVLSEPTWKYPLSGSCRQLSMQRSVYRFNEIAAENKYVCLYVKH